MTDGTGTTKYTYDQLDRLTESENGHKEIVKYEYNLDNQPDQDHLPQRESVTRSLRQRRAPRKGHGLARTHHQICIRPRLRPDSHDLPDRHQRRRYIRLQRSRPDDRNQDDEGARKHLPRSSTHATTTDRSKRPPAKACRRRETTKLHYDENNRLTKGRSDRIRIRRREQPDQDRREHIHLRQCRRARNTARGATYTYNELGERTKTTPETGPATTYGYDQAGNLISVERPKEGATTEDRRHLRLQRRTTTRLTNDLRHDQLPRVGHDRRTPADPQRRHQQLHLRSRRLPIEQINNTTETALYLHHDQAGSTRLLTGSTGTTEATYTYGAYGTPDGHTGTATTPLGYDGQYTTHRHGTDLSARRVYDPATAQFLTVDPLVAITGAPYNYADDNPLDLRDAVGLLWTPLAGGAGGADAVCGATIEIPGVDIGTCGAAGISTASQPPAQR